MSGVELRPDELPDFVDTPIRFTLANDANPELSPSIANLNDVLNGFLAMRLWATHKAALLTKGETSKLDIETCRVVINAIQEKASDMTEKKNTRQQIFIYTLAQPLLTEASISFDDYVTKPSVDLPIKSEEDIRARAIGFRQAWHDVINALSCLYSLSPPPTAELPTDNPIAYHKGLTRLMAAIDNACYWQMDEYVKTDDKVYEFLLFVEPCLDHYLNQQQIHVSVNYQSWKGSQRMISWSPSWSEAFVMNIAQNAVRSNSSNIFVYAIENNQQMDIYFDDDGIDPDPDIVEHGFQDGVSHLGGEGVGMAHHAKVLREHYDGQLTLEYRTDENGARIPGARVHLRLPAHNVPRE